MGRYGLSSRRFLEAARTISKEKREEEQKKTKKIIVIFKSITSTDQ